MIWVQLPSGVNAYEVHAEALKEKIAFMPGGLFSPSGKFNNHMRLNCGNPWDARIEKAIERIGILTYEVAARA